MGHTAWAPEGREGRSQAGPKGRKLEVGARRAPKLLVLWYFPNIKIEIVQHIGVEIALVFQGQIFISVDSSFCAKFVWNSFEYVEAERQVRVCFEQFGNVY